MADSDDHADESSEKSTEIIAEAPENGALDSIINEYEVIFKDRYTDSDPTFLESIENIISVPPIVHPWYNKARRSYDYSRDRSGHHDHHHHHRRHEHSSSRHGGGSSGGSSSYRDHRSERRYHPYHNDRNDRDRHDRGRQN